MAFGEAPNLNPDYPETLRAIRDCVNQNAMHAAELGEGRRFFAGYLPATMQFGARDGDDYLYLSIGVLEGESGSEYGLLLIGQNSAGKETTREKAEYYTDCSPQELSQHDEGEAEDWRRRLGAVTMSGLEAWYLLDDNDPSRIVQAAAGADWATQERLGKWLRNERPKK